MPNLPQNNKKRDPKTSCALNFDPSCLRSYLPMTRISESAQPPAFQVDKTLTKYGPGPSWGC